MKVSQTVTELCSVQECLGKNNQRGITQKLGKGEQSFLCMTRPPDLIHIPIQLHEDIPNGYRVMKCTRMFGKNQSMGTTWKLR